MVSYTMPKYNEKSFGNPDMPMIRDVTAENKMGPES